MTNNDFIKYLYHNKKDDIYKIFKYHKIYDQDKIQDLEMQLYEKLLKVKNINKYIKNDVPNMFIIFKIIKNIIITDYKFYKKIRYEQIENYEVEDIIEDTPLNVLKYNYIQEEIKKIDNNFKKVLIEMYFNRELSLRQLAKQTGIGIATIAPIIKNFKLHIQKEIKNQKF